VSGAAARKPQAWAWDRDDPGQSNGARVVDPTKKKGTVQVPLSSLAFYRRYTELLLRRYMQASLRMGRVPSVLGSCMFRGRVSHRPVESFEDAVLFVLDVERCMQKLSPDAKELVARIALQGLRTVVRKYGEAIDTLTQIFLEKELMEVGPVFGGR
jgi:hypothetical protein